MLDYVHNLITFHKTIYLKMIYNILLDKIKGFRTILNSFFLYLFFIIIYKQIDWFINQLPFKFIASNYCKVWSLTRIYGYFVLLYGVANFPNGFILISKFKWENNVDEILQGILFYLIAWFFPSSTFSV